MADNLFAACEARTDVFQGALKESDFAADLSQVLRGDAPDEYKKPELFFANTYPTKGLKIRPFDKSDALKLIPLLKSAPNATQRVEVEASFGTPSMRNRDHMAAVAAGIEVMTKEEAGYWLGMAMHRKHPRRVLMALRFLLIEPAL